MKNIWERGEICLNKSIIKDIIREIGKTKSRFFSIFAIIAIGTGFFAGLQATSPSMIATLEKYYDDKNLMDIRIVSTYGLDEDDVEALEKVEGVENLHASHSKDLFVRNDEGRSIIAKVAAFPDKGVNEVVLLEGRLPESPDECVAEGNLFSVGETVTVYTTDKDDPVSDSLERDTWTVVGKIMSPQYINFNRGSATIGDGSTDVIIMIPQENFTLEVFTEVYLTLDSANGLGVYSDEYVSNIEKAVDELETLSETREEARFVDVKETAREELDKAKKEIADAEKELADAEQKLADALTELEDAEKKIADGWNDYYTGLEEYNDGIVTFEKEIADAEEELSEAEDTLRDARTQYEAGRAQYEEGRAQFEEALAQQGLSSGSLDSVKSNLEQQIAALEGVEGQEGTVAQLEAQLAQVEEAIAQRDQLDEAEAELDAAEEQILAGERELKDGKKALKDAKAEGKKELEDAAVKLEEGRTELLDAEKELEEGWLEYNDGLEEFEEAKAEADDKIFDAKEDIAEAEKEISGLKRPEWYIFTREDNPGHTSYEGDSQIIDKVGRVFPIFFFLVAMLVCLTTMTRMVEEERTQVGTMKALGYGKGAIMAKFIAYSAIASLSGTIFGIAVCYQVFPRIIFAAYGMMYVLPELELTPQYIAWIVITLAGVICTETAVIMACYSELKECPAELMRPKAPKAGKRVLLEKIGFIWKRLSFTKKVTVRNLFRYKKRIFMTVLGIAGCSALTLTGFGIYASVSGMIDKQFDEIFKYDLIVAIDADAERSSVNEAMEELENSENLKENLSVYMMTAEYMGIANISLVVTDSPDRLGEMVYMRDRRTGETNSLTDEGVIITERLAEITDLDVGDEISFYCDGTLFETKVAGVSENYTFHFIYMTDTLYEELSKDEMKPNMVYSTMYDTSDAAAEKLGETLLAQESILALTFSNTTRAQFADTIESLNYVVVLIICCAATLAFVVLYNLTNINITERIREIATIKVLGFYDKEVSDYVFRENVILTMMGAVVGLFLGILLHSFVLSIIQTNDIKFAGAIPWWNYIVAFAMTMFFSVIVNRLMYFKLKKVSMVESLKSVE